MIKCVTTFYLIMNKNKKELSARCEERGRIKCNEIQGEIIKCRKTENKIDREIEE